MKITLKCENKRLTDPKDPAKGADIWLGHGGADGAAAGSFYSHAKGADADQFTVGQLYEITIKAASK